MSDIIERNWFQKTALWITIAGAAMVLYISYLLLWPTNVLEVVQPYKILTPKVAQGTKLSYEVEYCSNKSQEFIVRRQLLNIQTGELFDVPDRVNYIPENCIKEVHNFLTPMRADLGRYKMLADVTIKINIIRTEVYHYETEVFEIIGPEFIEDLNAN